jgi:ABC-type dipeptide/oligopeptide/nickel transport system permease subunit
MTPSYSEVTPDHTGEIDLGSPSKSNRFTFLRALGGHRGGMFGAIIVGLFLFLAIFSPWLAPYNPNVGVLTDTLSSPSISHPFGTDELGRDTLSRIVDGSRIAVVVAVLSVALALIIGTIIGIIAGYVGGVVDTVLTRSQDILFAFPTLLLAIIIVAVLGPGLLNAVLAIAIVYIPRFARVTRAASLSIRSSEFIDAARLAGVAPLTILVRHMFPNVFPSAIVLAALSTSTAQLAYASLSFLGLGVSPPQADWGSMLSKARDFVTIAPWLVIWPTAALVLLMLAFNVLGDAIRDVLDPKSDKGGQSEGAL